MPSLAATATPDAGPLAAFFGLLIIGSAVLTLGYLFGCWLWPFAACRRCHGSGKRRSPARSRSAAAATATAADSASAAASSTPSVTCTTTPTAEGRPSREPA
jgi:hypothetical protein